MVVIIAGGRDFNDYKKLCRSCDRVLLNQTDIEIVSGCANGADSLGERYAKERGYRISKFHADWDTYGKSAGYIRNEQMARYSQGLIAFWNKKSRGTKHMIDLAKKYDLKVRVVHYG